MSGTTVTSESFWLNFGSDLDSSFSTTAFIAFFGFFVNAANTSGWWLRSFIPSLRFSGHWAKAQGLNIEPCVGRCSLVWGPKKSPHYLLQFKFWAAPMWRPGSSGHTDVHDLLLLVGGQNRGSLSSLSLRLSGGWGRGGVGWGDVDLWCH